MNLTPTQIFARFRVLMTDNGTQKAWEDSDLLMWLNDGRSAAFVLRPDLFSQSEEVTLAAGCDQTVPGSSKRLLDVVRNTSHRDKRAITPVDGEVMNRIRPNRRKMTESEEVLHFLYDETDPTVYEVYPPAKAGTRVEVRTSAPPAEILQADLGAALTSEGELAAAYVDYIASRAFQQESVASSAVTGLSERHLNAFVTVFGGDAQTTAMTSPNATREGAVRTP